MEQLDEGGRRARGESSVRFIDSAGRGAVDDDEVLQVTVADKDLLDCNVRFSPLKPPILQVYTPNQIFSFLTVGFLATSVFLCSAPWGMPYARDASRTRSSSELVSASCVSCLCLMRAIEDALDKI